MELYGSGALYTLFQGFLSLVRRGHEGTVAFKERRNSYKSRIETYIVTRLRQRRHPKHVIQRQSQ